MKKLLSPLLRLPRWLLTTLSTTLILYLTLAPKPLPDTGIRFWEHTDKIVHAIMFGALYLCAAIDIWRLRRPASHRQRWLLYAAVVTFGAAIEIAQQAMDMGRAGSPGDWAADAAGALLALALIP